MSQSLATCFPDYTQYQSNRAPCWPCCLYTGTTNNFMVKIPDGH